jgi:leucyl-tRNA synthetase
MELVNQMYLAACGGKKRTSPAIKEAAKTVIVLLSPFIPHVCEELWQRIGEKGSVFKAEWPAFDKEAVKTETVEVVIQVSGKVRGRLMVPADASEEEIKKAALNEDGVKRWLENKAVKKFIIVPQKLINIVV